MTPTAPATLNPFSQIAATPIARTGAKDGDAHRLVVDITEDWLQGRGAFGGFQGALAALAMRSAVGSELPLRALQMTFIAALEAGPATLEATVVRRGRAITHAQCRLESAGRTVALLVGLYGASRDSEARVDMPAPADMKPLQSLRDAPFLPDKMPAFLIHYRQRWAGGSQPYSGKPLRPARMWAQLREAQPDDGGAPAPALSLAATREANLVAIADLPGSPALSLLSRAAPGASLTWLLEWLVDPRSIEPAEWIQIQTETRHAGEGYTSQTAGLWTASGRAIGVSHQTTAIFG